MKVETYLKEGKYIYKYNYKYIKYLHIEYVLSTNIFAALPE